jgi:excisionase family DNA binding protein
MARYSAAFLRLAACPTSDVAFVTLSEQGLWCTIGMTGRKASERRIVFSVPEVAARWGVSPHQVFDLCCRGELRHVRIGGLIRIRFRDIEAFEAQQLPGRPRRF